MKYSKALQTAAIETVLCVVHPEAWAAIRVGLIGLAFVLLRLVLLLTFPVSIPLIALAFQRTEPQRSGRGA